MNKQALQFISSAISCSSMVLLDSLNLLSLFVAPSKFSPAEYYSQHPEIPSITVDAAILTLEKSNVIEAHQTGFHFTALGYELYEQLPLIQILFKGYGKLIASQSAHPSQGNQHLSSLIDGKAIAEASVPFSEKYIYPQVKQEIQHRKLTRTLCDLGCGSADHLIELCTDLKLNGLGIDLDPDAMAIAKKKTQHLDHIEVLLGDITQIQTTYLNVDAVMQWHVLHDISDESTCVEVINSTLTCFPNLQCFFYVDIVTPSAQHPEFMPGFDYIHGLQNIRTRTYEETLKLFDQSQFTVEKEIKIKEMPNTFFWILTPL